MKLQITRNNLLDSLLFTSKIITSKTHLPILSGVMIEAENLINIYSTDLETSVRDSIEGRIIDKGRAVISAKVLVNILRSFTESKMELELLVPENKLKITCQNAIFTINTYPVEEYPQFPESTKKNGFLINIKKLKELISKVIKSVSLDEGRVILTGILMEICEGKITMVATDSYRLSLMEDKIEYVRKPLKIVIPSKVLDCILKSDINNDKAEVFVEENQISFKLKEKGKDKVIIVSRLLSGKFPEYDKLIPKDFKNNIIIEKEKILDTVRRISSISQDNIPIKLVFYNGNITISMDIKEVGSSSEGFSVPYTGEKMEIAFNPHFLIDGISLIDEEKIVFCVEEPLKPVLLKPLKNDKLVYLLMPIRIS